MLVRSGIRLIAAQELPRVSISQSRCLSGQVGYTYLPRVPYYRFNLAIEMLVRSGQNDVTVAYFYYQVFQSRHRDAFQVRFPRRRDSQLATPIVSISQSRGFSRSVRCHAAIKQRAFHFSISQSRGFSGQEHEMCIALTPFQQFQSRNREAFPGQAVTGIRAHARIPVSISSSRGFSCQDLFPIPSP